MGLSGEFFGWIGSMSTGRVVGLPLACARLLTVAPANKAGVISLWGSWITFWISLVMWSYFDSSQAGYQMVRELEWLPWNNASGRLGIDGLSRFLVVLNAILVPLCIQSSGSRDLVGKEKLYYGSRLTLAGLVNLVFVTLDLRLFYLAFEAVLLPMFLLVGCFGSRARKIRAAYRFFLYTLVGSLLMLLALVALYGVAGTFDMEVRNEVELDPSMEKMRWLAFFVSLGVKVPRVPFHVWLPEAHVEAPTAGSVLLAGILLKLGTYGLVRRTLPLFPMASVYFTPLVHTLACVSVVYASLTAIRQTDLKRIIAYASVAHMSLTLVGIFSRTLEGLEGSVRQMLSHGVVSGALFRCVGVVYERHHTRMVQYYGGLAQTMPLFAVFFLAFTMGNIALPGSSSFVGERLILLGIYQTNSVAAVVGMLGMVLGGGYSLWLFNRVVYGNIKTQYLGYSVDRTRRERMTLLPLARLMLWIGVYPEALLQPMHESMGLILENVRMYSV